MNTTNTNNIDYTSLWQDSMPNAAWGTVALFAGIVVSYLLVIPIAIAGNISYPIATIICSYLAFASFTVAHEAGHGNIFQLGSSLKPLESVMGWMASVPLLLVPYRLFQKIHDRHHAFTNDPEQDPDYLEDADTWLKVFLAGYLVPLRYHQLAFTRFRNVKVIRDTYSSTFLFLALVSGSLLTMASLGYALEVLSFAVLPLLVAIFFLVMFFDYIPHHPHKSLDRYQNTRVFVGGIWNALLLGQNYHLMHHMYPRLPWYKYQEVFFKTLPELERNNAPIEQVGPGQRPAFLTSPHANEVAPNSESIHRVMKVANIKHLTTDSVSIEFELPGNGSLNYQAGQYITLSKWLNGSMQARCYSLCTSPSKKMLKIGVRETPNGTMSTYLNQKLNVGDELVVKGPFGDFVYPSAKEAVTDRLVLIAGGSGITPILSILQTALEKSSTTKIDLIYACRDNDSIMFFNDLADLSRTHKHRFNLTYVIEQPGNTLFGKVGRVDAQVLREVLQADDTTSHRLTDFYICGPEPMKNSVIESLDGFGIEENRIYVEQFVPTITEPVGKRHQVEIYLADGNKHQIKVASNQTVLEVANSEGVHIPHACGTGTCGSCKLKVTNGETKSIPDTIPGLASDERNAGFTLACQCKPTSDVSLTESYH